MKQILRQVRQMILGPGISSSTDILSEDDLLIADAVLAGIRKVLKFSQAPRAWQVVAAALFVVCTVAVSKTATFNRESREYRLQTELCNHLP